jgi:hypothetical protein
MNTDPYSNQAFTKYSDQLTTDALNQVKGQYAGAGYTPETGTFGKSVAEGVGRAVAPVWAQERSNLEAQKMGAINSLYQGGNTTAGLLSGLDQTALANRQAGIGVSSAAQQAKDAGYERQLQVEQMARGLPVQNLAQIENLLLPIAQLGGTQNTHSVSTAEKQTPMGQQIMGGLMGGVGLLSGMGGFGPTGWMLSSGTGGPGFVNGLFRSGS